jgi:hypothetical protein
MIDSRRAVRAIPLAGASERGDAHRPNPSALVAGGAKAAWFKDSEGNILALIEGA